MVKTSTMFVGELEFADVAGVIDPKASTAPLAFAFLLAFVFLIVVVLMRYVFYIAGFLICGLHLQACFEHSLKNSS